MYRTCDEHTENLAEEKPETSIRHQNGTHYFVCVWFHRARPDFCDEEEDDDDELPEMAVPCNKSDK